MICRRNTMFERLAQEFDEHLDYEQNILKEKEAK